jgi:hypothetical protein
MTRLVRRRTLADGRVEEFTPMRNADGYYILADRAVDPQHNKAVNQFFVRDLNAVIARIRRGGVSLRMQGEITGQPNLISAREILIEDDAERVEPSKTDSEDDPFASFEEWASAEDDRAYRSL